MRLPTGTIDQDSSPSFSSMLTEAKNRPEKPPDKRRCSADLNFEFTQMSSRSLPSPADVLFSNGQLLPQSLLQNNSKTSPRVSRDSSSNNSTTTSRSNSSSRNSNSSSNSSSNKASNVEKRRVPLSLDGGVFNSRSLPKVPDRVMNLAAPVKEGKKKKKKKRRGIFGSFVAACRQCHALEPSKDVVADNILAI